MPRGSRLRVLGGRVRQPHPTVASEALSASVSARPCPRAAYSFVSPVVSPARATTTTLCGVHARCHDIVAVCTHLAAPSGCASAGTSGAIPLQLK